MSCGLDLAPNPAPAPRSRSRAIGRAPPHLLHVFPNFAVGGAQMRFAALVDAWGDRFLHTVIALDGDYTAASILPPDAAVSLAEATPKVSGLATQVLAHRARLDELRPDLLMTYNWGSIEVALANLVGSTPHLHMEDGFGPEEISGQLARRVWTRRVALRRSQVIVPSLTLRRIALDVWGLPAHRVHHIANGISAKPFPTTRMRSPSPDLPEHIPWIAWVGGLRPEKNPLRILRAFAPLKHQAILLMLGEGPERDRVVAEAKRLDLGASLRLLGRRDDARDILMQCQLLALSSDTEQMPLVVLEAMDAGLAVASTDVGDVASMVAAANKPFVVPPDDQALSDALRVLVTDDGLRGRIARANRVRCRATYGLSQMTQRHCELVEQLVSRRHSKVQAHA